MSAPNINNILLGGCACAYIAVFFVETEAETVPLTTICVVGILVESLKLF